MLSNPIYTGIGPFPQIVDDETWIRAGTELIAEIGAEALPKEAARNYFGVIDRGYSDRSTRLPLAAAALPD